MLKCLASLDWVTTVGNPQLCLFIMAKKGRGAIFSLPPSLGQGWWIPRDE